MAWSQDLLWLSVLHSFELNVGQIQIPKKVQNQTICDYPHYSFSGLNITKTVSFLEKNNHHRVYMYLGYCFVWGKKKQKTKKPKPQNN